MDGGSWHYTMSMYGIGNGDDQKHPQDKEMQKGKMVVWGGLTDNWGKKKEKLKAKEKIKDTPVWMQNSKEEQREIRQPS